MIERLTLAPHSPEWHAARRWRVGGSEVGQICGWSPWGSPLELAERKLSGETTPPNDRQQLGLDAELMLTAWAQRDLGVEIDTAPGTWIDDLAVANPDGMLPNGFLVEYKTVNDRAVDLGWGRAGTDLVPLYYAAQVVWYCGVLGAPGAHLYALAGAHNGRIGLHVAHYFIPAKPTVYAYLRRAAESWRETHLEGNRP